jgi:Flp pilus assembly pilin Flp
MEKGEEGQAVIEYILMLVVTITIVSIIGIGFRKTLFRLWGKLTQEIAAACPGCPPDPRYKIR